MAAEITNAVRNTKYIYFPSNDSRCTNLNHSINLPFNPLLYRTAAMLCYKKTDYAPPLVAKDAKRRKLNRLRFPL